MFPIVLFEFASSNLFIHSFVVEYNSFFYTDVFARPKMPPNIASSIIKLGQQKKNDELKEILERIPNKEVGKSMGLISDE